LKGLIGRSSNAIACTDLARALSLDASQIRKDLEIIGVVGKPRVGHNLQNLLQSLENFLGCHELKPALLAGAGPLGRALLNFEEARQFGMRIVGVFEADEHRIGGEAEGLEIMPLGFLPDLARMQKARIGIVTLPGRYAQNAADLMVKGGIRAIWNFSPLALRVPPGVIVENQNLFFSLAALSARVAGASTDGSLPSERKLT
jgi:redox-sensing transcriptional repressor